jgi:hypothetical protein
MPAMNRNLRSSIDNHAVINEDEVPLVPLRSGSISSNNKATRVSRPYQDDEDNDDDAAGWELDDFNSLKNDDDDDDDDPATTPSRSARYERVNNTDEESKVGIDDKDDDPALAMVKAVVPETDDPSLPNLTFRVWFLGSILAAVGAAISQLFFVSGGLYTLYNQCCQIDASLSSFCHYAPASSRHVL